MATIDEILRNAKVLKDRIDDFWKANQDIAKFPPYPDEKKKKLEAFDDQINYKVTDDVLVNGASSSINNIDTRSEKKIIADKYFRSETKQSESSDFHFKKDLKKWLSYETNEFKQDENTQLEWNNFKAKANSIVYADQDTVDVDADEAIKKIEQTLPNKRIFVNKYFLKFRKREDLSFIKF